MYFSGEEGGGSDLINGVSYKTLPQKNSSIPNLHVEETV